MIDPLSKDGKGSCLGRPTLHRSGSGSGRVGWCSPCCARTAAQAF